jgi:hypothetical protein
MTPGLLSGFQNLMATNQQPMLQGAAGMMSQGHPLAGGFAGFAKGAQDQERMALAQAEQQRLAEQAAFEQQMMQQRMQMAQQEFGWQAADRQDELANQSATKDWLVQQGMDGAQADMLIRNKMVGDYIKSRVIGDSDGGWSGVVKPGDKLRENGQWVQVPGSEGAAEAPMGGFGPVDEGKLQEERAKNQAELERRLKAGQEFSRNASGMMDQIDAADERNFGALDNSWLSTTVRRGAAGLGFQKPQDLLAEKDQLEAAYAKRAWEILQTQKGPQTNDDYLRALKTMGGTGSANTATAKKILADRAEEVADVFREANLPVPPELEAVIRRGRSGTSSTPAKEIRTGGDVYREALRKRGYTDVQIDERLKSYPQ